MFILFCIYYLVIFCKIYSQTQISLIKAYFVSLLEGIVTNIIIAIVISGSRIYGIKYNVDFSEQKPSTDTVAANPDNSPFRNDDGTMLFRPGGHGALIENLNEIDAETRFMVERYIN